jgi:regulation of enolase protein 1 (concanavalin A-like superfamily)
LQREDVVSSDQPIRLPEVPLELRWRLSPERWDLAGGTLTIRAGARTDLFVNPSGSPAVHSAPHLLGRAAGDFLLSARVTVDFAARFDAGALLLYRDEEIWAKLCFEYAPQNVPTVVSVVTRGLSDDCNSYPVEGSSIWLRVARRGAAFAFHSSTDGEIWKLVRHFALPPGTELAAGFLAQSPEGDGCTATFDSIDYRQQLLGDLRSGD